MIEFSEIQSEEGMYRAIGRRVVQLIEGELEFAAKKGSKGKGGANKKDCKKGISCGSSCIAKSKACVKEMSASQKAKYNALLKKVKAGGGGGADAQQQIDKMAADQVAAKTGQQPEPAPVPAAKPAAAAPAKTPKAAPKTKSEEVGTVKPTLKAQEYNPYAIKDLDVAEFRQFREDKAFLSKQPEAYLVKPFAEIKNEKNWTRSRHKQEIIKAINNGKAVDEAVLIDAKIGKADLAKARVNNELASQDRQQRQERVDRIQKAIDQPLMTPEDSKGYKPLMNESEASNYTAGSYAAGLSFYHGNNRSVTDSVERDGALPEKNNNGIFGKGFYLATSKAEAEEYAKVAALAQAGSPNPQKQGLLSTQVKVKNPYVASAKDIEAIGSWLGGDQSNGIDSTSVSNYLKARGHDSIYVKDLGYFVAFDQKQVVTFNHEKLTDDRIAEISRREPAVTWNDVRAKSNNSETGKALSNQPLAPSIDFMNKEAEAASSDSFD